METHARQSSQHFRSAVRVAITTGTLAILVALSGTVPIQRFGSNVSAGVVPGTGATHDALARAALIRSERPGPVGDIRLELRGDTATLSWSAPAQRTRARLPVLGYIVVASSGSTTDTKATALTVSGLKVGDSYTFSIVAYNSVGTGDAVSTPPTTLAPLAETSFPATGPDDGPQPRFNHLETEDGLLSTSVGYYYTLAQPVPEWEAVLDMRMTMVPYYFDGHNPGVFTPLLSEHIGSYVDYWDGRGLLHRFRIVAVRSWDRYQGEPPPVSGGVVAQFQTCRTLDGSVDWIYDAVAA